MTLRSVWALALMLACAGTARANLLINGSLETSARNNGHGRVLTPTDAPAALGSAWTITQGTVDLLPNTYWQASDGRYSVDLIGSPGLGAISQTVTGLTIGQAYLLTFDFSINPDPREKNTTKILQIEAVGASVLATQTYQRSDGTVSRRNMQYTQQSFQFTADSTSVTLTLSALTPLNLPSGVTPATSLVGPVIDNLDLEPGGSVTPFPEPASLGILGLGACGLLLRRRRA